MEFESIRIFSIINDLPESVTPRGMVNAVFAISGITHPKACVNHDFLQSGNLHRFYFLVRRCTSMIWFEEISKKIHQQTQKFTQETVNLVKDLYDDQQLRPIQKFNIHKIKNFAFHSSNS